MSRTSSISIKFLQAIFVVGLLAGCTTEPENKSSMMGSDKMDMSGMQCSPDMMKNMFPEQKKMMKHCMGSSMDMSNMQCDPDMMKNMSTDQKKMMKHCMGSKMDMKGGSDDGSSAVTPQSSQTDDSSHAQHHPAENN